MNKLLVDIPGPRGGLIDLDVNVGFEPPTNNLHMLLIMELDPFLNLNKGTIFEDVVSPILDVPSG